MKITLLFGIFACFGFAQPPDLIRVVRGAPIQPYVEGKSPVDVIGVSAVSGAAATWLIELHNSFASIEDLDRVVGAAGLGTAQPEAGDEVLPSSRTWIARHRPALSYRPELAIQNLPKARYLDVTIFRVPPGSEADFAQVQKLRESTLDSINSDRPDIAYEVVSGAPAGTFISLTPLISLKSLDDGRPQTPVYAEATAANAKKLAGTMQVMRERLLFRMEPGLSYVSEQFASPNPGFWHPAPK